MQSLGQDAQFCFRDLNRGKSLDFGDKVSVLADHADCPGPTHTLDQYTNVAVGKLQALNNGRNRPDLEDSFRIRVIFAGVPLSRKIDSLVALEGLLEGQDR